MCERGDVTEGAGVSKVAIREFRGMQSWKHSAKDGKKKIAVSAEPLFTIIFMGPFCARNVYEACSQRDSRDFFAQKEGGNTTAAARSVAY